jgi:hypothetical protein
MYVFTSAIFFLVFYLMVNVKSRFTTVSNAQPLTPAQRAAMIRDLEKEVNKNEKDTSVLSKKLDLLKDTTRLISNGDLLNVSFWSTGDSSRHYSSLVQYDSIQKTLSSSQKDGWFMRMLIRKQIELTGRFEGEFKETGLEWIEVFLHKLPYLLFVSLPIFALILKILYIRRRRYYVDHTIFTIHHYIFSFIILLVIFLLGAARAKSGLEWLGGIQVALFLVWPVYLYIAMLNFYKQGWFKTFVKFSLLNFFGLLSLLFLFAAFLFLSIFQM